MTDSPGSNDASEPNSSSDSTPDNAQDRSDATSSTSERADALKSEAMSWWHDLVRSFVYLTRIYVPPEDLKDTSPIVSSMRAFPAIGALVGLIGGLLYLIAVTLDLSPLVASGLCVTLMIAICGALHEVGFAGSLVALSGNAKAVEKASTLRSTDIDAYGTIGLILILMVKVGAIAQIGQATGPGTVLGLLVAASAISRAAMVGTAFWVIPLDQPKEDFQTPQRQLIDGVILAVLIAVLSSFGNLSIVIAGSLAVALLTVCISRIAVTSLGGQSPEVQGAVQVVGELGFYLVAAALLAP